MDQLRKYAWLIDTIRRAGKISHKELSDKWERHKDLSDCRPLPRATFNRWRDAIFAQFGIIIDCQKVGGFLYYIANPEDIDEDRLKKWMLDSFAVGHAIGENLALKGRIIVDEIPSGREHLTPLLAAMADNRIVRIAYRSFQKSRSYEFPIEPYCVKLFENRWYVLARSIDYNQVRLYGLDRIESLTPTDSKFQLPKEFKAEEFFATTYGIVMDHRIKPERIVIRANRDHAPYLLSLPLHHSQRLIADTADYADFELYLAPTYDFIMKLLQPGAMVEVIQPESLRAAIQSRISEMFALYSKS